MTKRKKVNNFDAADATKFTLKMIKDAVESIMEEMLWGAYEHGQLHGQKKEAKNARRK